MSLKTTNINLVVMLEKNISSKAIRIHPLGTKNMWTEFRDGPVVVKMFQSEPNWWIEQSTLTFLQLL